MNLNIEKCKGCSFCVKACPLNILKLSGNINRKGYVYAELSEPEKCKGCGLCFQVCPDMVINIEED